MATNQSKPPEECGWKAPAPISNCDFHKKGQSMIFVNYDVHVKIDALTNKMGSLEWMGYLDGQELKNGYSMSGIRIPEQIVTQTTFKVTKSTAALGSVHSHHGMGEFHSATDVDFVGANHIVTLVYNGNGKYAGRVKVSLPCGEKLSADAAVVVLYPEVRGTKQFVDAAIPLIKEEKQETTNYSQAGYQSWMTASNIGCAICGKPTPWGEGVQMNGERYCKGCISKAPITNRSIICAACHRIITPDEQVSVSGVYYHFDCLPSI
jgi:hypothetical protein